MLGFAESEERVVLADRAVKVRQGGEGEGPEVGGVLTTKCQEEALAILVTSSLVTNSHNLGHLNSPGLLSGRGSEGQAFDHSLARSPAQGLTRLHSDGIFVSRFNWGRICFQPHSGCWWSLFP